MKMKFLVLICMGVLIALSGCRAADEVKQGGEGEFCNARDSDCRDGFICQGGVCQGLVSSGAYTCQEMCTRLQGCNAEEADCVPRCQATFRGVCPDTNPCPWSSDAVDAFGTCIVEELSCEEARMDSAPDLCFQRIDLDEDRGERCDAFVAAIGRCDGSVSTDEFRRKCFVLARTATEESFTRTDACVDRIADGLCNEIGDCFNSVFQLDAPFQFTGAVLGEDDVEF